MDYVLQEDGTLKESVTLIQARLADLLKPLGDNLTQVPKLKESPVTDVLLQNELLFVNYDYLLGHMVATELRDQPNLQKDG